MSARLMHIGALVGLAALLTATIASARHRAQEPAGMAAEGRAVPVFNPVDGRARAHSGRPERGPGRWRLAKSLSRLGRLSVPSPAPCAVATAAGATSDTTTRPASRSRPSPGPMS
jgi:hypothetical protein